MTTALHTIYAVDIDSTLIDQVTDQNVSPGISQILRRSDGQVYPTFNAAGQVAPSISFSTQAIATALGKVGTTGFALASGNPAILFFQKLTEGATRAGASSHLKMTVNEGIIVPRRITADANDASIEYDIVTTYDGTNAPIVLAASQSLAGSPAGDEGFVVGPATINGTQLQGIQSLEVDFGIDLVVRASDGQLYPTYVAISSIAPTITVVSDDAIAINTLAVDGAAQGATPSAFWLRALTEGGGRTANASSAHIKIVNTASKGRIQVDSVGGDEILAASVTVTPTSAGVNHPLTITTGTTITSGL